ncbi:hypothetical protein NP493_802g02017 [Ridgeia piscesae]|uniref:small monomeric GTPase n=1 Tax=Ridgeia piscesae TaxID=27915 RepID=A0AAD9KNB5_RIDPI|nr:hypothetical protein NP493_802g02017 [Ridgeia piscesae]
MDTYDTEGSNPDRYLKWAHGFVVVYCITSESSLDTARDYLETITQYQRITGKDIPISLVGNKTDLERYRTVSKMTGESLARQYECSFHETSAADDYRSVELVFHSVIRDIARVSERLMPLQPLFISEDKSGLLNPVPSQGLTHRTSFRRAKSPKSQDVKDSKKDDKDAKVIARRTTSTFRIFNKSFKIFN